MADTSFDLALAYGVFWGALLVFALRFFLIIRSLRKRRDALLMD